MRVPYVESHRADASSERVSRCRGALLGTVVGDALGRPFEGAPSTDAERLSRALARRVAEPRGWGHSDDGEMMLAVAESLCTRRALDEDLLLRDLADGHDPARGYGKGTRATFRVCRAGGSWQEASRVMWAEGSRGNGGAVRVAPIAVFGFDAEEASVAALARRSARCTHSHPEAMEAAAVVAIGVHRAVRGEPLERISSELEAFASGQLGDRVRAATSLPRDDRDAAIAELGNDVLAVTSVPAALWAFVGASSFSDAVVRAVGLGGDTDSIGAIAGALAGAAFGADAIPARWLAALEPGVVDRVDRHVPALLRGPLPTR